MIPWVTLVWVVLKGLMSWWGSTGSAGLASWAFLALLDVLALLQACTNSKSATSTADLEAICKCTLWIPLEPYSNLWHPKSLSDNPSYCSFYISLVLATATTRKTERSWEINLANVARLQDSSSSSIPSQVSHRSQPGPGDVTAHVYSACIVWSICKSLARCPCGPSALNLVKAITCTETPESSIFFWVSAKSNSSKEFKSSRDFSPGQYLMSIRYIRYTFVIFRRDWSDLWWVSGPRFLTSSEPSRLPPWA